MKTHIFTCLIIFVIISCGRAVIKESDGPLKVTITSSGKGKQVAFQYHAGQSYLAGSHNVEGRLYYVIHSWLNASDISISRSDDTWHGSFTLPDSTKAFAFKFSSADRIDDNQGLGYIFPMIDRSGNPVPGALLAESRFYTNAGEFFLNLAEYNPDSVVTLIQREYVMHPGMKKTWPQQYFNSLYAVKKGAAYPKMRDDLKKMLSRPDAGEKIYTTAYYTYRHMNMDQRADSLKKVILQKFPTGLFAQNQFYWASILQKNPDSLEVLYNRFKRKFHTGKNPTNIESALLSRLIIAYAKAGRFDKFNRYVTQISDQWSYAKICNQAAYGLGMAGRALSFDSTVSQRSLHLMKQMLNDPYSAKPASITKKDWLNDIRSDYGSYADTYAMIMSKKGDLKRAVVAQKTAVEYTDGENPVINERYAEYLVEAGDYETANKVIPEFFADGQFTTKMKDYLKTVYTRQKGSAEGFTDYADSLILTGDKK